MTSWAGLRNDHDVIDRVLEAVEGIARLAVGGRVIPMPLLTGATEFFAAFVEGCHEAKEEQALVPVLERTRIVDDATLRTLRADHADAAGLLGRLRPRAVRRERGEALGDLLGHYVALGRRHVAFENTMVLPRLEAGLSPDDDRRLQHDFDVIEERALGSGGRDAFLGLAGALTEAAAAYVAESTVPSRPRTVRELLRGAPVTLAPDDTLARAADVMGRLGQRELPVVVGDALVGILARVDLEPHHGQFEWTLVRTAMTPNPVTIAADTPVAVAARMFLDLGFNGLPVVENRRVLGLVRRSDLLHVLAEQDDAVANGLAVSVPPTSAA